VITEVGKTQYNHKGGNVRQSRIIKETETQQASSRTLEFFEGKVNVAS
jgi:hypothetical protein